MEEGPERCIWDICAGALKLLSGFAPATPKEDKSDKGDDDQSDEDGEAVGARAQRPGGGDND